MFTQTTLIDVLHFFILFSSRINWDNKTAVRAILKDLFKKWRQTVFHEIKEDYLLFYIFDDEEVDDDSCLPSLNLRSSSFTETGDCVASPAPALDLLIDECINEILQLVRDISNKINDIKVREKMAESLKCMVCFESKPSFVQFCKNCG